MSGLTEVPSCIENAGACGVSQLSHMAGRTAFPVQQLWLFTVSPSVHWSGTRAVAVDFNLYNTNTKLLTVARIVVEFYSSSYVIKWHRFYTFRISLYDAYIDQVGCC
jgi:hypothetical protein